MDTSGFASKRFLVTADMLPVNGSTATFTAKWGNIQDIKKTFNSVDYAGNKRYVFNIGGNNYRLVAMIFFEVGHLYIRFVGTHAEYDKIDSSSV